MGNLFNPDNAFFSFMGKLCDMFALSLAYALLCLPIITIGPASAALYYTIVKVIRRERGYAFRSFLHSFKQNFKQGAIISVIFAAFAIILIFDYQYASYMRENGDDLGWVLTVAFNAILIISLFILVWIFPLLSRFSVSQKQLFKNSILISVRHFPTTLALIILLLATLLGTWIVIPAFLITPALFSLVSSFLIERVMKKYTPKSEGNPEETGIDEWYNE